jgi:Rieske Fe-S protein
MKLTRREFVKASVASGAALAGGVITVGCGNNVAPAPLALPVQVTASGKAQVPWAQYPDIQHVGGALTVPLLRPAMPLPDFDASHLPPAILVLHRPKDMGPEYIATTSACPHQACPLGYNGQDDRIECPCHASAFRTVPDPNTPKSCSGQVVHLPAASDLIVYPTTFDGSQTLTIDLSTPGGCSTPLPPVVNNTVTVTVAQFPQLAMPGGFVVGTPTGGATGPIIIIRSDATTVAALSATCTHMDCPVAWVQKDLALECPCHGSQYSIDGHVTVGPAKFPLTKYGVTFDGMTIVISVM